MKRVILTSLALAGLCFAPTQDLDAQEWFWGLAYQVTTPTGDTKDFADDFSFRNLALDARGFVQQNASIGLFTAWNVFADRTDDPISFGDVLDIGGAQFRYINAVPVLATAHYYLGGVNRRTITPYVGLGVGGYWVEQRLEIGLSAVTTDQWHFGVSPEIGFVLPVQSRVAWYVNARYHYAAKAGNFTHQWLAFGIGFAGRT